MKFRVPMFENLKNKIKILINKLKIKNLEKTKGRKLAISIENILTIGAFKNLNGIPTKKKVYQMLNLKCSYKTLVVNLNRFSFYILIILQKFLKINREKSHIVKHTDSTDIPVCLNKNAKNHKTMKGIAKWKKTGKGSFYGLKLHITTDLKRNLLSFKFTSGNIDDREVFLNLNKDLKGIFIADAGYISEKLAKDFYIENERILIAKPRINMKKLATEFENLLYDTRMLIELNFRSLKMFYGLVSSLPRSIDGYLSNYLYSIFAYQLSKI